MADSILSSHPLPLPPRFGFVAFTVACSVFLTQWQALKVGLLRRKIRFKYPKMYENKDDSIFNCYQRAHQNTLESYPAFLILLVIGGLGYPIISSIFGMVWIVGRLFYSLGYYTGDPKNRMKGEWNFIGLVGLLVTTIVFGIQLTLSA